ncbi:hypothetical protein TRIUR3_13509 [Triticum urartu]|uniref:Uncharacterized protein n=1 Tax=Triticum urartu TaxID=4572 RepID=M7YRZ5_TRIUA|nr:hypothetical protein TRIUR3_13509 [Triticum urartu]
MASSGQRAVALAALVVVVLVARAGPAGAARQMPVERSGDRAAFSALYPAATVVAAEKVEMLMARLPAGPSKRGAGH